ncbi:hypothetical protein [Streptomyces sp. NBC_01565]|nr:hypothetical protein [Streptomyces sp. NBC_01565]MCX4545589.1 hypothetical protein [Streptomyces sp. NBC_01565]
MAFLGRHVHWALAELLTLDHSERLEWIREIAAAREGEGEP